MNEPIRQKAFQLKRIVAGISLISFGFCASGMPALAAATSSSHPADGDTASPIKHLIVVVGENRSFDHLFATYVPPKPGEKIDNLLSKGIINADGTPGPHYAWARQNSAIDEAPETYLNAPGGKAVYNPMPPLGVGGPATSYVTPAQVASGLAAYVEPNLPASYYQYLVTGGTGQSSGTADQRLPSVNNLSPGPYQLSSPSLPYDSYTASPVHRFYQMWQQLDCSPHHIREGNPSGCAADLFPWVEVTTGAGTNGLALPSGFTDLSTGEGSAAMGFYNVQAGDVPVLKKLADEFTLSDNYHQAMMGGTGINHIALGYGDAIWFSDGNGHPAEPPHNQLAGVGTTYVGTVDEVENPNPAPGTNNWYTEDGYGGGGYDNDAAYGGGTYSNCSDLSQPGVAVLRNYLASLPRPVDARCAKDHDFLLNNYNPGYFCDGSNAYTDTNSNNYAFTIPPSSVRNIGDALLEKNISFAYYGDGFNFYLKDPYQISATDTYCTICNFFQYSTSIMTNAAVRTEHLKDATDLYTDIQNGTLPAISYVKPGGLVDGHPASSKADLFEGFVLKLVTAVQAQPELWKDTAILITFDEGGGYYDSGYVQPLDYFGDGTRIPLLVVSPYAKKGHVSHDYSDHVSVLKFIERNWHLKPLTERSRDNLPDPIYGRESAYAPINSPAIGDLFDNFEFEHRR